MQSDPIGLDGGINTYAYVGGNPLMAIDRFGLAKDSITTRIETLTARGDMQSLRNLYEAGGLNPTQAQLARNSLSRLNEINHIFNKGGGRLGDLVQPCGGKSKALDRLQDAITTAAKDGKVSGIFEHSTKIQGVSVTIRGRIVNGVAKIGTAF